MTQNTSGRLKRITCRLWQCDVEWLKRNHPDNYNAQIRLAVAHYVSRQRRKGAQSAKQEET